MTIQEAIAELVEALTMGVRALQEKDRRVRATARATREGHTGRRPKWTHGDRERVKAARIQGRTHTHKPATRAAPATFVHPSAT